MKCNFLKISWGIVEINGVRVYTELWLATGPMNLKIKFKTPKGTSCSYVATEDDCPFDDGSFISYWVPKNVYFPVHFCDADVNKLVTTVVDHLQLKFFEEPRKWLTKEEKSVAELLALKCCTRDDLEWMLACDVCDIPQAFWEYAKSYGREYDAYLDRREKEDREMAEKLNTPEGLAYMLRMARMHGEHQLAVSFIKELIFDLTELWDM